MALTKNSKILASDVSGAIKSTTRSGTTFTYTTLGGSTGTFTQQDNNTTYSAATSSALGLVKIGSNISVSSGTISLTKSNVTSALGYTPPTSAGVTTVKGQLGSAWAANSTSTTLPSGGTWFVWNCYGATGGYGVGTSTGNSGANYALCGGNFSGGTKVYAKRQSTDVYSDMGLLAAVRIA